MTRPTDRIRFQPDIGFWRHRKVAVTGATGFLGSHLTRILLELEADVVALVRDDVPPSPISAEWYGRVPVVHGACEDQVTVERMLGDYEVRTLFHLAAQSQVGAANRNPVSTFESNVAGTWSVLEAARRSPLIAQIATASSDKAYGAQPMLPYTEDMRSLAAHPYDVSKACSDMLAQTYYHTYGLPLCVTRCGNFFGPGDRNWERIVPGTVRSLVGGERPLIRSDGSMIRDYLYVIDGALAYLQLVEAMATRPSLHGEAFNFSAEFPITVLELVELIQKALGTDLAPDVRAESCNEIKSQYLSATKAHEVLGWWPNYTLDQAISNTVDWYERYFAGAQS